MHAGVFLLLASVVHSALHLMAVGARIAADRPAPSQSVILREAAWSVLSSCSIVTVIDMLLDGFLAQDGSRMAGFDGGWLELALTASFLVLWGDAHFYWTHRMLHAVPSLYRHVHSIHHHSRHPNALSGLCFHPVESLIYFSQLGIFFAHAPSSESVRGGRCSSGARS
jgi:sterol desaturase/sphingolipid hydroxylase (fatty acid hydroxylase superfamily)